MQNYRLMLYDLFVEHRGLIMTLWSADALTDQELADAGIAAKVSQEVWDSAVRALVQAIKNEKYADGFVEAIRICGEVLAERQRRIQGRSPLGGSGALHAK